LQDKPSVRRNAKTRFERSREMADGHSALSGDKFQKNSPVEVFAQKLGRAALLPGRKAVNGDFRQANQPAVGLEQMRAEH
jgi:hypothetical protein